MVETKCYRKDGKLIIEIPEEILINGVVLVPMPGRYEVADKEKFLNFVTNNFLTSGDDGDNHSCSDFTRLIDGLVEEAAEFGAGVLEEIY